MGLFLGGFVLGAVLFAFVWVRDVANVRATVLRWIDEVL